MPKTAPTSRKNGFNPLVSCSLALALSMSIASANNTNSAPQIQSGDSKINFNENVWTNGSDSSSSYQQHTGDIIFTFVPSDISGLSATSTPLQNPNGTIDIKDKLGKWTTTSGYLISQSGRVNGNTVLGLTSNTSIKLVASPSSSAQLAGGGASTTPGTLYFNFIQLAKTTNETNWAQEGHDVSKDPMWGSADNRPRKMILDLSKATQGEHSLEGNIVIDAGRGHRTWGENVFEATFGKGMKGDLTIRANAANFNYEDIVSKIVFLDGSKLEGNVTISEGTDAYYISKTEGSLAPYAGNNLIFKKGTNGGNGKREEKTETVGGITGLLTATDGYTTLWYETNTVDIKNELDLRGGTVVFSAWKNIDTALKDTSIKSSSITSTSSGGYTITLDTSDSTRTTNDQTTGKPSGSAEQEKQNLTTTGEKRSKIDISGGNLVFDGFEKVIFTKSAQNSVQHSTQQSSTEHGTLKITPQYEENPKYQASQEGQTDQKAQSADSSIPQSITRQGGSVKFLIDDTPSRNSTTIIQGNIDANKGSIFFSHKDPSKISNAINPFAPTASTQSQNDTTLAQYKIDGDIKIKDGGLSAFWDDEKGFTAKLDFENSHTLTFTGMLVGKNDMWIESAPEKGEKGGVTLSEIDAIQANRGVSHLVFENKLTIKGMDYESAKEGEVTTSAKNAIATSQGLQLLAKGETTIQGDISAVGHGKNLLIFEGQTTFSAATEVRASDAPSIKIKNQGNHRDRTTYNTLVFKGSQTSLKLKDIYLEGSYTGNSVDHQFNILSFNDSNVSTAEVNGNSTLDATGKMSAKFGTNIIGKDLYKTDSMQHNTALFVLGDTNNSIKKQEGFDTNFMNDTYQAKGTYKFADSIIADQFGKNYINVENLEAKDIQLISYTGANFINVKKLTLKGDLSSTALSKNIIKISGSANSVFVDSNGSNGSVIEGKVIATSGENKIDAQQLQIKKFIQSSGALNTIVVKDKLEVGETITQVAIAAQENSKGIFTEQNGKNNIQAKTITINSTSSGIEAGSGSNDVKAEDLTIKSTGTSGSGAIYSLNGTNNITAKTIDIDSQSEGIWAANGTNNITVEDTLKIKTTNNSGKAGAIYSQKGINNITAKTITIEASGNKKSSIHTDGRGITNITLKDSGSLEAKTNYNGGSKYGLVNTGGTFNLTLEGDATIKARFDMGSGTNNFNLGLSTKNSTRNGKKTITLITNKLGNSGKTTNFNFNQDDRTLTLKGEGNSGRDANNDNGKYADYSNADNHHVVINFKAKNGVFDVGGKTLDLKSGNNEVNVSDGANGTFQGIAKTSDSGVSTVNLGNHSSLIIDTKEITETTTSTATNKAGIQTAGGTATINFSDGSKLTIKNSSTSQARTFLESGIETSGGTTNINFNGKDGTLESGVKTTGGSTTITILNDASGTITNKISTSGGTTTIDLSANSKLTVNGVSEATGLGGTIANEGIQTSSDESRQTSGGTTNINFNGTGGILESGIKTSGGITKIEVKSGASGVITGKIENSSGTTTITLNNGMLSLIDSNNSVSSLVGSGGIVNLAMTDHNGTPYRDSFKNGNGVRKTLTIGGNGVPGVGGVPGVASQDNSGTGFKGQAIFEVYAGGGQSDTVVFKSAQMQDSSNSSKSVATIIASGSIDTILNGDGKTYKVATVENGAKTNMEVVGGERLIGGVIVETVLTSKETSVSSSSSSSSSSTEYYLGKGKDKGLAKPYQEVANSALIVNYDLYLANFNSLNKRMGELRDNPYNHGVWTRVFGGAMSNDFGAGSKTEYIIAQGGYDYALSVGNNAKNYTGVAIAYGASWTKGNTISMNGILGAPSSISLSSVNSSMVEVGIYNSYVADSGWYNDSILKFDYIMSDFSLSNDPNTMSKTNNFAMILSDEFGYRYQFGGDKSWYIDPQVELGFGYFNQSDFNRVIYDVSHIGTNIKASQDSILTLRSRIGASLGKKFITEKGFASVYVGAFYEYDYIEGGKTKAGRVGGTMTSLDTLESNGRAIVNIGSNIGLTENARLYVDVEKSFGDKQRTYLQFNAGARYSFGEKSANKQTKQTSNLAPLKLRGE